VPFVSVAHGLWDDNSSLEVFFQTDFLYYIQQVWGLMLAIASVNMRAGVAGDNQRQYDHQ
jgi:hypothetical protein